MKEDFHFSRWDPVEDVRKGRGVGVRQGRGNDWDVETSVSLGRSHVLTNDKDR